MHLAKAVSSSILILNLAILLGAHATTMEPLNLEALARRSESVVHAKVESIEIDANRWRRAELRSLELVSGRDPGTRFSVQLLQRASREGGWVERVADAMELKAGEEVLLFLRWSAKAQQWVPLGLKQGKYRVQLDRLGARRALSWRDGPINAASDAELLTPTAIKSQALDTAGMNVPLLSRLISDVRGLNP